MFEEFSFEITFILSENFFHKIGDLLSVFFGGGGVQREEIKVSSYSDSGGNNFGFGRRGQVFSDLRYV